MGKRILCAVCVGLSLACGVAGLEPPLGDGGTDAPPDDGGVREVPDVGLSWPGFEDAAISLGTDGAMPSSAPDADMTHGCPPCAVDERCDEAHGVCVKLRQCGDAGEAAVTCQSAGVQCGSYTYLDPCDGEFRTLDCGGCEGGQECRAGRCRCQAPSDQALCQAAGAQCGVVTTVDVCGDLRSTRCGACGFDQVCLPASRTCQALPPCAEASQCPASAPVCRADGFCVECAASGACPDGQVCHPELNLCLQCLQDADCPSGAPRCLSGEGRCVACLVGPDCESGLCSADEHTCSPASPANDGCAGAQPLALGTKFTGSLARAGDDAQASCGGDGPDVAFTIWFPQAATYEIVLTPSSGLAATVSARASCSLDATELGCASESAGQRVTLVAWLPAGAAAIWVDGGASTGEGTFELEVRKATGLTPPANDACGGAERLSLQPVGGKERASATGSTVLAGADYAGSCGYTEGPEVVYTLSLAAEGKVTATVASDGTVRSYQPAVYLRGPGDRTVCAAYPEERACGVGAAGGSPATAVAGRLAPGDYYVVVDGSAGSAGGFKLEVDLEPPMEMADGCPGFAFTPPAPGQTVALEADTAAATGASEGACGGSGPDTLYTFALAAPTPLTVRLTSVGPGAPLRPLWYLRKGECGSAGTVEEVDCVVPGEGEAVAEKTYALLPAGTWWLWVDGFGGSRGAYRLEVSQP